MIPLAFTWQRHHRPLPTTAPEWRRQEKIAMAEEAATQHPYAGMSVLDILWQDLDDVYDRLMDGAPMVPNQWGVKAPQDIAKEQIAWGELRGQAQGLAFAIAVLTNPYAVDVDAVRKQARERYENNGD